jgi:hypothetical protein
LESLSHKYNKEIDLLNQRLDEAMKEVEEANKMKNGL